MCIDIKKLKNLPMMQTDRTPVPLLLSCNFPGNTKKVQYWTPKLIYYSEIIQTNIDRFAKNNSHEQEVLNFLGHILLIIT